MERFQISGTFVDEGERRLINSFGHREEDDLKSEMTDTSTRPSCLPHSHVANFVIAGSWMRFLLKEVKQERVGVQESPADKARLSRILGLVSPLSFLSSRQPKKDDAKTEGLGLRIPLQMAGGESASHAGDWTRCSFFLRVENVEGVAEATSAPSFTSTLEDDHAAITETSSTTGASATEALMTGSTPPTSSPNQVTLICFDTPVDIVSELEAISSTIPLNDILEHPYILWELIAYHLSSFLEEEVLKLTECFGTEQKASS